MELEGWEVPITNLDLPEPVPPDFLVRRGPFIFPTRSFFKVFGAVSKAIKDVRPDLVYLNNTLYGHIPSIVAARLNGCPTIAHLHDTITLTRAEKLLAGWVDRFIALTQAGLAHYVEQGIPKHKLVRVYNGIDLSDFDRKWLSEGPVVRQETPTLGIAATLHPRKGHAVLFHSVAQLIETFPDLSLLVAGEGASRNELEQLAANLRIDRSVRFLGYVKNMAAFLKQIDVLILPSFREGLPIVLFEAMAAAKPVVASDLPGTRELVRDGESGFLVPSGDAKALAKVIRLLLENRELRIRMGQKGRALLESGRLNADATAEDVTKAIWAVLAGRNNHNADSN